MLRLTRDPFRIFSVIAAIAPAMFTLGMALYFTDRDLGDAYKVEEDGVIGLAANLSLIGLTAVVRFVIVFGPQFLILVSIALPVVGSLYAVERADNRRIAFPRRRRVLLWSLACGESLAMLALFVVAIEMYRG